MEENKVYVTDPTMIAMLIMLDIEPLEKSFQGNFLAYVFPKEEMALAQTMLKDPLIAPLMAYRQVVKSVLAEVSASRRNALGQRHK